MGNGAGSKTAVLPEFSLLVACANPKQKDAGKKNVRIEHPQ
jgi:hypothetical protein